MADHYVHARRAQKLSFRVATPSHHSAGALSRSARLGFMMYVVVIPACALALAGFMLLH